VQNIFIRLQASCTSVKLILYHLSLIIFLGWQPQSRRLWGW
jgi:hypothetical protein